MNKYVVDAWAWVEYFRGRNQDIKARIAENELVTSVVTIAEVASKFNREGLNVDEAFDAITTLSKVVKIDANLAKEAGVLHSNIKKARPNFSLADAFVLCTAKTSHAKVLTGDPDFKGLKDAIIIK